MKRERFVKIVMGYGLSRNEANSWANEVKKYGSYKKLFARFRFVFSTDSIQKITFKSNWAANKHL